MKNKKLLSILGGVLAIVLLGMGIVGLKAATDLDAYKKQVAEIVIEDVDLTMLSDGHYLGSYEVKWVAAEEAVTMEDHRISAIELLSHKNGKGKPAEVILDEVLDAQTLEVDVVSGATSSSKVILKAVENALEKGPVLD